MYKSLKSQLVINNLAVLLIFGAIQFVLFSNSQYDQRKGIRESFQVNADKVALNISQNFYNYYHNIQGISKNKVLRENSFEEGNFLFNELMSLHKFYDFMLLTDLEGNYIASNDLNHKGEKISIESFKKASFADRAWFKETLDGNFSEEMSKGIFGSRVGSLKSSQFASKAYGKEKYGFHISTQVTNEYGDPVAILTGFISSNWIKRDIESVRDTLVAQGITGTRIEVFNKKDQIIGSLSEDLILLTSQAQEDKNLISNRLSFLDTNFFNKLFSSEQPLVAYTEFNHPTFLSSLGWKVLVTTRSNEAFAVIESSSLMFSLSLIIALIFMSIFTFMMSNRLSRVMEKITEQVSRGSAGVDSATSNISEQASILFDMTTDQASSLQQTVSSLTEISAMVGNNTAHAQNSKELSRFSKSSANSGVDTIDEMIISIEEISSTNQEIINQMNKNSSEMSEIIKVISNIEEKTKVINDIVFQTKLLSFNASVEAARAGEHGKSFSVVAEEVGNLAKTSGEAAKEIEELLHKSIGQVKSIVESNKVKVEDLVSTGTTRVEAGKSVAGKCKVALEEILNQSEELDKAIEDIASASIEQSKGIEEITKAMDELDLVTKKNSEIARVVSRDTDSLMDQSSSLNEASGDLFLLINGRKQDSISMGSKTEKNDVDQLDHEKEVTNILQLEKNKPNESIEDNTPKPLVDVKRVAGSDIISQVSSDDDWEDL